MVSGGQASSAPVVGREIEPTIFEMSVDGRRAGPLRTTDTPEWSLDDLVPPEHRRAAAAHLPEVSERDLVAHTTRLTHRQYSVDLGAYPLGSCTMKYNPKLCDDAAGLARLRHRAPGHTGGVRAGLAGDARHARRHAVRRHGHERAITLAPPAGASGELTGLLLMRAFHESKGRQRTKVIIPDSAHGTNPASVTLGGYETITVPSDDAWAGRCRGAA